MWQVANELNNADLNKLCLICMCFKFVIFQSLGNYTRTTSVDAVVKWSENNIIFPKNSYSFPMMFHTNQLGSKNIIINNNNNNM